MSKVYKILMLLIKQSPIFSLPYLRNIRWGIYRRFYNAEKLFVDEGVTIVKAHNNSGAFFKCGKNVHIGKNVYIDISGGVEIIGDMSISEGVKIYTHNHSVNGKYKNWKNNETVFSNILIEKNSWIGADSIILPNVKFIAEGSIIAAGSVLTKDTEPYYIYAGNPAQKISKRRVDEK